MAKTFYQRDTNLATAVHAATNEDELSLTAGTGQTEIVTVVKGTSGTHWCFTTLSTEPNEADWPNGTYRAQLDVSVAGADLLYGFLTVGTANGHFARVDSGLTADLETIVQAEAAFSGTGLKLATAVWNPAAGAADNRFEALLAVQNQSAHANEDITLVFDADGFVDGPWTAAVVVSPPPPTVKLQAIDRSFSW